MLFFTRLGQKRTYLYKEKRVQEFELLHANFFDDLRYKTEYHADIFLFSLR